MEEDEEQSVAIELDDPEENNEEFSGNELDENDEESSGNESDEPEGETRESIPDVMDVYCNWPVSFIRDRILFY